MKFRLYLLLVILLPVLHAEDALFFGNSFTEGNNLPKLVEAVATSKAKALATVAHTRGGMGWSYHLSGTEATSLLKSKAWDWVIIQDFSTNPTHAEGGKALETFMRNGQSFYDRIAENSPRSTIVLFETWAYAARHSFYTNEPNKFDAHFASPDEMHGELKKNYSALQALLRAKDPQRQVRIAPVGDAFSKCIHEHPDINLYSKDLKHPSLPGSYLAALVIYSACFNDSPIGAAPAEKITPEIAKKLQEIAASVTQIK